MNQLRIDLADISFVKSEITYLHSGKDIGSGAFDKAKSAEIRIKLPRCVGAILVKAKIYDEGFTRCESLQCKLLSCDFQYDVYSFRPSLSELGLYFFDFEIKCSAGVVFGKKGRGRELVLSNNGFGDCFQYSVCNFCHEMPKDFCGGIIYHVFVDRFCRGGSVPKRNDAVLIEEWEGAIPEYPEYPGAHLENNTFFGGTLWGVIDKLDYLKSLGTTLIYLSPVFEAYSNHKYDTGNYMKVDDMFGSDEALAALILEAKKRNIGIILDGVFNHTGSDSIYFNSKKRYKTVGAYQSKDSEYYKWFDFQSYPDKYTCWWGIKILPRIKPDIPECQDYFVGNGGVIEKYADMGIAGFRLDVADELSDNFIAKIKARLESKSRGSLLYGEVWEDASNKIAYDKRKKYYLGQELDGVMNYPIREGIISLLRDKDPSLLDYAFTEVTFNAPKRVRDLQMNLLGTHDTERIITILAGESADGKTLSELSTLMLTDERKKKGIKLVKLAYTILATIPGIPAIFYGDEVGLEGYKDPFNRRPYPWNSGNAELRCHYQLIGKIRRESSVFSDGDFKVVKLDKKALIFERIKNDDKILVAVNLSDEPLILKFNDEIKALISDKKQRTVTVMQDKSEIISLKTKTKYNFN